MRTIITTIALAAFGTWSLAAMAQTGAATGGGTAETSTANGTDTAAPNGAAANPNQPNGTVPNPNPPNGVGAVVPPQNPAAAATGRGLARPNASGRMSTVPGTGITGGAGGRAGFPGNTGPMGQSQSTFPGGASMARPNSPSGVGANSPTMNNNINNLNVPPGATGTSAANAGLNPNPAGDVSVIEGGRGGFPSGNIGGRTGVNGNIGGTSGAGNGNVAPGGSPNAGLGSVNGQVTGRVNPNAAQAAQLNNSSPNNWRMVNQNGQWWYWTPSNYWMYYSGNAWSRYVPPSAPPMTETPLNGTTR